MKSKHNHKGVQPGVKRHVMEMTGPEAFKITPKKPNPDSRPIRPAGKKSVDKADKRQTATMRKLDNVKI